ncbi:MAG: hypothetical protein VW080_06375 [Flavobacteriaceae bacterium]
MLSYSFLAISLGFILDNFREDYSEKQNAESLLKSLHNDLKGDVIRFNEFENRRKKLISDIYNFLDDVEERGLQGNDVNQQKLFAIAIFNWIYFEPNTANIEQIISSGALRYLGDDELIHQIGVTENQNNSLLDRQKREQEYFLNYLQPLMHKYYNFKWLNKSYAREWISFEASLDGLKKTNPTEKNMLFWDNDHQLLQEITNLFENYIFILRSSFVTNYDMYIEEMEKTIKMIEVKSSINN